ncbi:hypothetical protein NL532_32020 [Mesorhizobium sp. C120A]|uniref:hypothetical protein n=1 Tax=unclassified Mesorhizobium TaxID=325217 RepID=UPI0003CFB9C1|nr:MULTISPECIES: hypothetical protein [unclassified Mesorhizobium]ESZ63752.1 hypothetical protein X728_09005 [Mesorhizobium sp. L103C120A0]WJI45071.1 hypothetical protein NL532_32020 [Mesorhizobium sp. C120A]
MNKRFLLSALAVAMIAFSACSAPAAEFDRVTIATAASQQEHPPSPAPLAVAVDFDVVRVSHDVRRIPAVAVTGAAVMLFAVYRLTKPAAGPHRPYAVPWPA